MYKFRLVIVCLVVGANDMFTWYHININMQMYIIPTNSLDDIFKQILICFVCFFPFNEQYCVNKI